MQKINEPIWWKFDQTGLIAPAVQAYLKADPAAPLTPAELAALRGYLRQWLDWPWLGPVDEIREQIDSIDSRARLAQIHRAMKDAGMNPF